MPYRKKHLCKPAPTGAAVAELAICLPAIVLLVMGAIECCTMIFVKQSLHVTAYEGVRVAIKRDSEDVDVMNRCNRILQERSIVQPQITITPADIQVVPRGAPIEVSVSAPCSDNSPLSLRFFGGSNLVATATMIKE